MEFDPALPIEKNFTPPASWYTHQDFYTEERESLFKRQWIYVGSTQGLSQEGDYKTDEMMGIPYLLTLNKKGLQGFFNVCSHHGTCVAQGKGNSHEFVCPYHGWTYGPHGELKKAPKCGKTDHFKKTDLSLKSFPLKEVGPFLFAYFGKERKEFVLDKTLSSIPNLEDFNFIKSVSYPIECNWKVFVDNYLDGGYHVPHMHPSLTEGIDFNSYQTEISKLHSLQTCLGKEDKRLGKKALYYWFYPNFMVNRYGPWMDSNWVIPLGVKKTLVIFDYYLLGEHSQKFLDESFKSSHQVQKEDEEICLLVQKGLESSVYDRGVYAPQFEKPMFHFHQLLADDLTY